MNRYIYRRIYNYINSRLLRVMAIELLKSLNKPIYRIALDTNNLCNLKCIMCRTSMAGSHPKPQIMSLSQFESLAREVFPKTRILDLSCGFEPFMTKNFLDYLRIARCYCKGQISIVTNGLLIKEKLLETIAEEGLLDEIIVSLDGLKSETYNSIRKNGSFDNLLKVLELIRKAKVGSSGKMLFRLNYTMMRRNIEELYNLYDFARYYSVDIVQIRHMTLDSDFSHLHQESLFFHQETSDRVIKKVMGDFESDDKMKVMAPPLFSSPLNSRVNKASCAYPWFFFIINSAGVVGICQIGQVGNIFAAGLQAIERSDRVRQARKQLLRGQYQELCKGCSFTDTKAMNDINSFISKQS